jgi:hypothetical protein
MSNSDVHISARCSQERKDAYIKMARQLGYRNFSEFLLHFLDAMTDQWGGDNGFECHLLHIQDERVVGMGPSPVTDVPRATAAFAVVAPKRFWRHVKRVCDDD